MKLIVESGATKTSWRAVCDDESVRQVQTEGLSPTCLDVERMQESAQLLLGTHDFSAFCANKKMKKSTVRTIKSFTVQRVGEEIRFTVTGNGFLHNMVRILVGTLVEVGRGEREMDSIPALFGGKREDAGFLAPGKGLCLMEVRY
jgi:tRNA pseudouridine38-40 synthase